MKVQAQQVQFLSIAVKHINDLSRARSASPDEILYLQRLGALMRWREKLALMVHLDDYIPF